MEYGNLPKMGLGGDDDDDKDPLKIKPIENGMSINELIGEFNGVVDEFTEQYAPLEDGKDAALKASGMEKKKTAGAKECMLGLAVAAVAEAKMT